jgi:nitrous oxidase accessory protein NosD
MRNKYARKSLRGGKLHRFVAVLAGACVLSSGALAASVMGSAASAGAAPACDVTVDANGIQSGILTIQGGIDASVSGDTICVWPGLYNQDQALARDPNTGGAGSNDFNIFVGKSVTILGLDSSGNAITAAPQGASSTAAPVVEAAASEPDFGSSNIFVQAANVTLSGLEINGTPNDISKSVEIVGNGVTVTDTAFAPSTTSGGVGIYISDFHFNPAGSGTSTVTTYNFTNNTFDGDQNESAIYVASGAGWTGPASGRVISGNAFSNLDDAMDFAGPGAAGWLVYPVGAATITGNTFATIARRHLEVWGDGGPGVGYMSPDWCGIMANNTFDGGSFIWQGTTVCPSGAARTWASGAFTNIAGLYSKIQPYGITKSQAGDTVQVLGGTYNENLTINHALTLKGANAGVAGTGVRGPESLVELLAADSGSIFNITTADPVTIDGFRAQFNGTEQNGGVVLSLAASNQLTFKNNLLDNSTYVNTLIFDDSAATSTFTNNKFTGLAQTGSPGTGVVAAWGTTPGGAQAVVTIAGNTFSALTDNDGVPAINLNTVSGNVTGNTFQNIHQYGILLADKLGNLTISGNLFDNIKNDTPGPTSNRGAGIRTFSQPNFVGPVNITGNTFTNNYFGVRVANDGSPADISNGNFKVNRNNIATSNSSAGISLASGTVGTLNGTCNWWGQTGGPIAGQVQGSVTTSPFLRVSNLAAPCPATVPSAPQAAFAVPFNDHGAKVVWTVPASNGGAPITGYKITPYAAGVAQPAIVFNSTATTQQISGLTDGASYRFTVAARNVVGFGPPSAQSPAMIAGAPGQPGVPTVVRTSSGKLKNTFAAPMNNGAAITSYTVTCASSNGGVTKTQTGTASPITVTALTPGKSYTCRVSATNSRGTGPLSNPSAAINA